MGFWPIVLLSLGITLGLFKCWLVWRYVSKGNGEG